MAEQWKCSLNGLPANLSPRNTVISAFRGAGRINGYIKFPIGAWRVTRPTLRPIGTAAELPYPEIHICALVRP